MLWRAPARHPRRAAHRRSVAQEPNRNFPVGMERILDLKTVLVCMLFWFFLLVGCTVNGAPPRAPRVPLSYRVVIDWRRT